MEPTQQAEINFTLIGDRILIKLDEHPNHTMSPEGIIIPQYEVGETPGGKPMSRLSSNRYLYSGTIIALSPYAQKKLEDISASLRTGDRVLLAQAAVSPMFQFFLDRSKLVIDFDGYICIPHNLIEAKQNNG